MVTVDTVRCAYCGGCVSVCPVAALTLAETRLTIDESCIDCGDCISACPMAALSLEQPGHALPVTPRRRSYDVVVVGAGPAGSVAAQTAAQAGLSVLLLEKRQEIGSPVRCAEGVGHDQLSQFIEPDHHWITADVNKAEVTAVAGDSERTLQASGGNGYILERRVFDRVLAERAIAAGAEVCVKTAVSGVLLDGKRVCGVRIGRSGAPGRAAGVEVSARVVIAADGVEAQVGQWAGMDVRLPLSDCMVCAQYLLAGIDLDPACTYYVIGSSIAPGGYAWVFPKGEGRANVGLGVQADLWQAEVGGAPPAPLHALDYLNRFVESRPALAKGHAVTLIAGNVPVAVPPQRFVMDGLMLVGDASRQVDPLTGGGIINAMTAGRLAAQAAVSAIAAGDPSAARLASYEQAWLGGVGRRMQRNYRLRGKFAPDQRTDEHFLQAFMLAAK